MALRKVKEELWRSGGGVKLMPGGIMLRPEHTGTADAWRLLLDILP